MITFGLLKQDLLSYLYTKERILNFIFHVFVGMESVEISIFLQYKKSSQIERFEKHPFKRKSQQEAILVSVEQCFK